jgi:hypothetical protein
MYLQYNIQKMSEKDFYEWLQGVILWFKNIWLWFAWFLASCFYKGAKWIETSKKKEIMRFWLTLCILTIIWAILKILWIVDINQQNIIYFIVWAFSIKFMEMLEKKFESLFDKVKIWK